MVLHSILSGNQLHNPKGLRYAEDIDTFASGAWHNSGLMWNKHQMEWIAKPSGTSGGGDVGASNWAKINDGYGITAWDDDAYAVSGAGADLTISVDMSNFVESSTALSKFYPSTLGQEVSSAVALNTTHRLDNTQAHSDYLLNNADDTTSGFLTAGGFGTAGDSYISGHTNINDTAMGVLTVTRRTNTASTMYETMNMCHKCLNTAGVGLGVGNYFKLTDTNGNMDYTGLIGARWQVPTAGSERAQIAFNIAQGGTDPGQNIHTKMILDSEGNLGIGYCPITDYVDHKLKVSGSTYTHALSSQTISGGTIIGGLHHSVNYVVWSSNALYYTNGFDGDYYCNATAATTINHALTQVSSNGGGSVYIMNGGYPINATLEIPHNTIFRGNGKNTLFLMQDDKFIQIDSNNVVASDFQFTGKGFLTVGKRQSNDSKTISDIILERIRGYHISTNLGAPLCGILIDPPSGGCIKNVTLRDCEVSGTESFGIGIYGDIGSVSHAENILFDGCRAYNAGDHTMGSSHWSVGFDIAEKSNVKDIRIINCLAKGCWESGFHSETSPTKENVIFQDCISIDNGLVKPSVDGWSPAGEGGVGITFGSGFLTGGPGVKIYNCIAERNILSGFNLIGGTQIVNCTVEGKGITHDGIYYNQGRCDIDNCIIQNISGSGIYLYYPSYSHVTNNLIRHCGSGGTSGKGIRVGVSSGPYNNIFDGNVIEDVDSWGIYCIDKAVVTNNIIKDAGSNGIYINGKDSLVSNNYIKNPTLTGIKANRDRTIILDNIIYSCNIAIDIGGKSNCLVSNNYIQSGSNYAIDMEESNDCVIANNSILGHQHYSIYAVNCDNNQINDNRINRSKYSAIYLYGSDINTVNGNTCINTQHTSHDGIWIRDSDYNIITNNCCYDNQGTKTQDHGINESDTSDHNIISNNMVSGNADTDMVIIGTHTICKDNIGYITENSGWATGTPGGAGVLDVAHGLAAKPTTVYVTPSGAKALSVGFKCDATNISISANTNASTTFSWFAAID